MQCCFLFSPSRMSWNSQSRNTLTITYFWCVFSACEYLSHTTPCYFNAMRICLFRNERSSRSKVLMVWSRGLIKGFWEKGYRRSMWVSVTSNHVVCKVAEIQWWKHKRKREERDGQTGYRREVPTWWKLLLKYKHFHTNALQNFYYLMLLTASKRVVSLNLPGLKLQFKGGNVNNY